MKIGILIKSFSQLRDFELRIIQQIQEDPTLELALLVQDGSSNKSNKNKLIRLLKSKKIIGILLFRLQMKIEKKLFKSKRIKGRDEIIASLSSVPTIQVSPVRKGPFDNFSDEESEKVSAHKVDILLRQGFGIIKGNILTAAKHGIWSFHHGDNAINRGGPPAFWEIVLKEPVIGVTLQQLTTELDGGLVIDKGFYKKHWSVLKSNRNITNQCVSILFKNIKRLQNNELQLTKSKVYYKPLYKSPPLGKTLKYMFSFYRKMVQRIRQFIMSKVFKRRYQCWTLFLGKGNFMEATLHRLKPSKLPKGEFWADPFLIDYKESNYIFFENYSYKTGRGKISCGKVEKNKLVEVVDVLEQGYHLSYPQMFWENDELFMIPETLQNKRVEVYKCIEFPKKWELYSSAFEGESIVDTTYFKDEKEQRWLFLNKGYGGDNSSELHIYKIDSLKLNSIEPHKQNPVIIDVRKARNAGSIFKYENQLIRPSQNNSHGVYGYGLNLNQIIELNIDKYSEEKILTVEPDFKSNLMSTHHLSQSENLFVIDAAYKFQ